MRPASPWEAAAQRMISKHENSLSCTSILSHRFEIREASTVVKLQTLVCAVATSDLVEPAEDMHDV